MGFGTIALLWLASGVFFWGAFVALCFGFRGTDGLGADPGSTPELLRRSDRPSPSAVRVLARAARD